MSSSIHDIKIETIDFDWIKQTTKINHLKRAIRIIEEDGNYYTEIKDACYARMEEIDPSCKRLQFNQKVSQEVKESIESELKEWQNQIQNKGGNKKVVETNLEDYEKYFDNETDKKDEKKRSQLAEMERVKGNEAIKSKDFDEAITYYTRSIDFDQKMFQSYGNRALAYLKKKQYNKCIEDCNKALAISSTYTKALHRKAKALVGLKRKPEAYRIFKQILKLQPENNQMNKQMMQLREEMNSTEIAEVDSSLIPKSEFKKIAIQEDSEQQIEQI